MQNSTNIVSLSGYQESKSRSKLLLGYNVDTCSLIYPFETSVLNVKAAHHSVLSKVKTISLICMGLLYNTPS